MSASRGRLGSYALWQLRDYFTSVAGIGSFALPFMLGVFPLIIMKTVAAKNGLQPTDFDPQVARTFDMLISATAWIGAMLSVTTMVSADRTPGLARFLFSKPVGVSEYYVQAWFVRGTALAFIALMLSQIINIGVTAVPWLAGVAAVMMSWVLIGGVGVLFSVLTARDGLFLIVAYLAINMLETARQQMTDWHWVEWVQFVLPPMQKLEPLRHALLRDTPMVMSDFWHVMGYGAACTALAAYLVRRLPLVR